MCLDKVTNRNVKHLRPKIGYKLFEIDEDGDITGYHQKCGDSYNINTWHFAENPLERIGDSRKHSYYAGFHIFPSIKEAKIYCGGLEDWEYYKKKVYQVEYLYPTAEGIDSTAKVIIAHAMRIIGKVY